MNVIPVVTPREMAAIDAAAPEPVDVLIERAGAAVARRALRLLGGSYGRRVHVIAGKGNNGNDGRAAARRLRAKGVRVHVHDATACPSRLSPCDLVIDAAYGTGFHGEWTAPDVAGSPVLAVDIPSGVEGLTGRALDGVLLADATVTFAALKPGLLFGSGPAMAGDVDVVDIGLDVGRARTHLVTGDDVREMWLPRSRTAHKWAQVVRLVAGGAGMQGAGWLAAAAAHRAGAGYVHVMSPGVDPRVPVEAVSASLPSHNWADAASDDLHRFGALVIGPGLGRADPTAAAARRVIASAPLPVVVDGDGLHALSTGDGASALLPDRSHPTVLTPHDGEFALLTGQLPGPDRLDAARRLARDTRAIVLLKGPTTVVAASSGATRLIDVGDERLATAGSGDVLSGIIGAWLAAGATAFDAATAGAWVHGAAARRGRAIGLVASDLPDLVADTLAELGVADRER